MTDCIPCIMSLTFKNCMSGHANGDWNEMKKKCFLLLHALSLSFSFSPITGRCAVKLEEGAKIVPLLASGRQDRADRDAQLQN